MLEYQIANTTLHKKHHYLDKQPVEGSVMLAQSMSLRYGTPCAFIHYGNEFYPLRFKMSLKNLTNSKPGHLNLPTTFKEYFWYTWSLILNRVLFP